MPGNEYPVSAELSESINILIVFPSDDANIGSLVVAQLNFIAHLSKLSLSDLSSDFKKNTQFRAW